MEIRYDAIGLGDREALAAWIASDSWPFHVGAKRTYEEALARFDEGAYVGDAVRSFWMRVDGEPVGLMMITDLDGSNPMLDLRLKTAHRGRGLGEYALRWLTQTVFDTWPENHRVEGQTREDNLAMRRLFCKLGYVKEGHYRQAWPTEHGPVASIAYGMLRRDWESGVPTPVPWEDEVQ